MARRVGWALLVALGALVGAVPAHADVIVHAPRADAIVHAPRADAIVHAPRADAIVHAPRADVIVHAPRAAAGAATMVEVRCGPEAAHAFVDARPVGGPPELALDRDAIAGPGVFRSVLAVPATTAAGRYELRAGCDDGTVGAGSLLVSATKPLAERGGSEGVAGRDPWTGPVATLTAAGAILVLLTGIGVWTRRRR